MRPCLKDIPYGQRFLVRHAAGCLTIMSRQVEDGSPLMVDMEVAEQPQGTQQESMPAPTPQSTGLEPKARVVLTYTGLSRCSCLHFVILSVAGL